jgi:NAD(P)H dehydrogenase (quinone)
MKVLIVFYSMHGHILKMAHAVAEGVDQVDGVRAELRRVPETIPEDVLRKAGAWEAHLECSSIAECMLEDLVEADAVIFGTPTRYGNMTGQMRLFMDKTGSLWLKQALAGKVGGVFTSGNTQHGGQESTILSFYTNLLHHGMVIAGLPYLFKGQMTMKEISGCSPYGASCVVGQDDPRMPVESELAGARFQGRYVALLTRSLAKDRAGIVEELKE